jgi:formate hydrogenlyase subunit 3/multisubunit Na+/H+ antiporter MnhD subunit
VTLFLAGIGLLIAGAGSGIVFRNRPAGDRRLVGLIAAGAVLAGIPAVQVLRGGAPREIRWHAGVPGGDWVLGLDPLSAVFLLTILVVGVASAGYGAAYLAAERGHRAVWMSHTAFALVLAAMALVVTSRSVLLFLGAWELMALGSYVLIVTEHEHAAVRRAGLLYLVATHAGTLALLAMFAVWSRAGGEWTFAALAAARPALGDGATAAVLCLALAGFGVKAGLVPFHFWLPSAHAAAPSHVSALMSGVVIKTGIYGILRVITLAGPPPAWWGWTVLAVGAASALLGVLWALVQHDLKRLLAYHSVENIGIILIGTGVGALGAASGQPVVAILGYGAAALHTLNHALFKGALFLAAGAVVRSTGTRDLERLGGLARRMPLTWLGFLVGAAAIIGVPPLNGFVSEWLVFQDLFRAGQSTGGAGPALRLAVFAAPALALVGGLALACFAKAAGIVFLGSPRSEEARVAREAPAGLLGPVLALALACVVIGVLPALFVRPVLLAGATVAGQAWAGAAASVGDVLADAQRISILAAGLFLVGGLFWLIRRLALRRVRVRAGETWGCGYPLPTPRMQYTASSFAAPLAAVFGGLSGVREHRGATVYHSVPMDPVLERGLAPLWARVERLGLRLRPMQQGRLHVYLIYVVVTVVALLVYLVVAPVR